MDLGKLSRDLPRCTISERFRAGHDFISIYRRAGYKYSRPTRRWKPLADTSWTLACAVCTQATLPSGGETVAIITTEMRFEMPCSGFSLPQIFSNPWATGLPQTTGRQSGLVGGGFPLCHVFKAIPCHHHPTIHAAFEVWNTRAVCERSVSSEHESFISLASAHPI